MAVQHPLCAKTVAASALAVLASGLGVFAPTGYLSLDDRPRHVQLQPAPTRKIQLQKRCQERGLRVLAEQSFMRHYFDLFCNLRAHQQA